MNLNLIIPEMAVVGLALAILLIDLWTQAAFKARLGCVAAIGLGFILAASFAGHITDNSMTSFGGLFIDDGLGIFFKRIFIGAAILVVLMGMEFADRIPAGIAEFHVLVLLALAGMMFAASANDFILVFVALELITVSFYVLVSFQRGRLASLEAGVKYLVMGGLSAGFLVFGIALLFAASNSTNFTALSAASASLANNRLFWLGLLLVLVGLAFKTAVFPMQMWAPDVYQGAPTPVTAFLAIASKAAGFVLLLRVLFMAVPFVSRHWETLFMIVAAITILYGNLCALPQRSLKRLLGYSSIAHAGYLMLGVAALNRTGSAAILYYLLGYLFTLGAAFIVICIVCRESDDISTLAGLSQRSPFLAAGMAMAMVSLAGIPPLAGFAGKLFLFESVVEHAAVNPAFYKLAIVAVIGVVISLAYYLGVVRAIYWSKERPDTAPIQISPTMQVALAVCMAGMLYVGLFPNAPIQAATDAVKTLTY
ncbi:MAG TPA: NADH-quinone oxidoreductase subunit N [Candidatus Acidoferrum sp.]|nr:NADH-quinone oxidoreductase subunit N [Candidatus Acidoferrum sp.]